MAHTYIAPPQYMFLLYIFICVFNYEVYANFALKYPISQEEIFYEFDLQLTHGTQTAQ